MASKLEQLIAAHEAGHDWAAGLKAGDRYTDALTEARARFSDPRQQRAFVWSALDVLRLGRVITDMGGVLLYDVIGQK